LSDPGTRNLNLISGIAAIGLVVALAVSWIVGAVTKPQQQDLQTYVAYFEDAGGIRAGDRVRIKGRTAGRVLDVRLVQHDGRTKVRVEVEIAPGSGSQWLKESGLPVDTQLRVQKPRLLGETQLVISPGQSAESIPKGGTITQTIDDNGTDQLFEFKAELARFNEYIDTALKVLDGPMIQKLVDGMAELARRANEIDGMLERGAKFATEISPRLQQATDLMIDLRKDLDGQWASVAENVNSARDGAASMDSQVEGLAEKLGRLGESIASFERQVSSLGESMKSRQMLDSGRQLRRLSAQARASMDTANLDPKRFGDMPTWRFLRKHYHGQTFTPGNGTDKYDDEP